MKRDTVSWDAVHIAIGVREYGTKEVLAYSIAPTESAYMWNVLLEDIKQRGAAQVLLFISDGLSGIVNAIETVYPQTKYQTYCVQFIPQYCPYSTSRIRNTV
ncbi:MAG: transposase [Paenibacillaceae bacterium]|nr:transposase [Paenibacillaceae bacterium]